MKDKTNNIYISKYPQLPSSRSFKLPKEATFPPFVEGYSSTNKSKKIPSLAIIRELHDSLNM
jgi:hypothetical protein